MRLPRRSLLVVIDPVPAANARTVQLAAVSRLLRWAVGARARPGIAADTNRDEGASDGGLHHVLQVRVSASEDRQWSAGKSHEG